jgi:CHRD domain-containing protein
MITASLCLALLTTAGRAAESASAVSVSARLLPASVAHPPVGVHPGARGTFSASFWQLANMQSARWALATRRLTGPALTAHIHTGVPGRNGPVLLTLCTAGRCNLTGSSFHAGLPAEFIRTMRLLGAYVDVHTKKNPRGELRGQIVFGE